jgi:hypothetical protein
MSRTAEQKPAEALTPKATESFDHLFSNQGPSDGYLENHSMSARTANAPSKSESLKRAPAEETILNDGIQKEQPNVTSEKPPSFFLGNGGLGLNLTAGTALLAVGYYFGAMNYAAVAVGGLLCLGVERATAPFFNTKHTNLLNFSHWVLDNISQMAQSAGKFAIDTVAPKDWAPTLKNLAFGAEFLAPRIAVAGACFAAGWTGLFGALSVPLCGLAGSIVYRGAHVAIQSFNKSEQRNEPIGSVADKSDQTSDTTTNSNNIEKIGYLANMLSWFSKRSLNN